jgi:hypothetical protein
MLVICVILDWCVYYVHSNSRLILVICIIPDYAYEVESLLHSTHYVANLSDGG